MAKISQLPQSSPASIAAMKDVLGVVTVGAATGNDLSMLQAAADKRGVIWLKPGESYVGSGTLTLKGATRIVGNGASLTGIKVSASPGVESVCLDGVVFSSGVSSGETPPVAVDLTNIPRVRIVGCKFNNVMVQLKTSGQSAFLLELEGNEFIADWTDFSWTTAQLDCLTIGAYRRVGFRGNRLSLTNVNRAIKISSGVAESPIPAEYPEGIEITGNTFEGSCAPEGGKQLIDCFSGTAQVVFADNVVRATGFSRGLENKTGFARASAGVVAHKVCNNVFDVDFVPVFFQGGFGATEWTPNSRDSVVVSGNTFRISDDVEGTVHARFLHSLSMVGNDFSTAGEITGKSHADVSSCQNVAISANTISGGDVNIGVATSNSSEYSFNSQPENIAYHGNVSDSHLVVSDASPTALVVTGNIGAGLTLDNVTAGVSVDSGNSWNTH